jgi:hypothetical protein
MLSAQMCNTVDLGKCFGFYRVIPKMSVLWDANHTKYYNIRILHKHDASKDTAKAMRTISDECEKRPVYFVLPEEREEESWNMKGCVCPCHCNKHVCCRSILK